MFCSPWIINRIGAKNTLLIAGVIMATRIIGSSFATTAVEVIALKMLHALEVPFLLVGAFKYITGVFDTRLSATIYLIGFQFAKQSAAIFLSAFAGNMYDRVGFRGDVSDTGLFRAGDHGGVGVYAEWQAGDCCYRWGSSVNTSVRGKTPRSAPHSPGCYPG